MSSPKEQLKIILENNCNAIFEEEDLRKAIIWYSDKPVFSYKKVFLSGNYPAVSIYDKKIHIHRLLMMFWSKRDLATNEYVHHYDGNKLNALKQNLVIEIASEHQSNHNKGIPKSDSFKRKISEANKKRKGIKYKKKVYENLELLNIKTKRGEK